MEKQQLEKYINEYGRDIYLFCKRLTQNKNTADDLYQETFLKLWELDNVNDTENPKSYLLGIAVNLWKNQCRKQMWRKQSAGCRKPFAGKTADSGAFVLHGKSESSRDCGADARIGQQYKK